MRCISTEKDLGKMNTSGLKKDSQINSRHSQTSYIQTNAPKIKKILYSNKV